MSKARKGSPNPASALKPNASNEGGAFLDPLTPQCLPLEELRLIMLEQRPVSPQESRHLASCRRCSIFLRLGRAFLNNATTSAFADSKSVEEG